MALTLILRELATHGEFSVAGIAHFNHQLRPDAGRDEQFCRDFAAVQGLPTLIESADVQTYAATQRLSIEDAARRLRYEFLHRAATELGADRIAVGHTQEDQAETFLLRLIRGAGLTGLAGIFPRRGQVIRPLLDVRRDDLRAFLLARGQRWVEDGTNGDVGNPRNRIRHHVLPELDRALAGGSAVAIARAADLVRDDAAWLDEVSERRYAALAEVGKGVQFDAADLSGEAIAIRRRLVLKGLRAVAGEREIGLEHVLMALEVLEGGGGVDVPGGRVELRRGKLVLLHQGSNSK